MQRWFLNTFLPIVRAFFILWLVVQGTCLSIEARVEEQPNPFDAAHVRLDAPTITGFGGRVEGTLQTREVDGNSFVFLGSEAMIVLPAERLVTPQQGSISFTVIPNWPGNDGHAHTFFHMAVGPRHITIFKTDANTLRFTYRGREEVYAACDVDISNWCPGEPHEVSAGWCRGYGDLLWIILRVDGREALGHRAVPLESLPKELFIGRRGPSVQPAEAWIGKLQIRPAVSTLPFAGGPKPPVLAQADWAVWADPRIVVDGDHGEKVVWRLMDHLETTVAGARQAGRPFVYNDQTIALYTGLPLIKGRVVTTPYFVWAMHHRLADRELRVNLPGRDGILDDDTGGLTATADDNRIALLLWHFDVMQESSRSWQIRLENLPPAFSQAKHLWCREYRIDREHNNPYTRYVRCGEDSQGGAYNLETAWLEVTSKTRLHADSGTASLEVVLPNMSVSFIEVCPD